MAKPCEHLRDLTAADFPPPRTPGACEECLKECTRWVELRECQACGHVGCCDSSPGKHATKHFHEAGHPVMRSVMPGATWTWCLRPRGGGAPRAGCLGFLTSSRGPGGPFSPCFNDASVEGIVKI